MMEIALIVNPCSGRKKTAKLLPQVKELLISKGITPRIFMSRHPAHLHDLASGIDPKAYSAIIAMGGDGTNFHLINGLLSANAPEDLPPLGIIPAGSGNSFVRDLNIFTPETAVQAIAGMRTRPVDILRYTGENTRIYFVNLMGLGFVTDVAVTAQRFKWLNDFSYLIGVARQTLSLTCDPMEITVDGRSYSGRFCFVEFCNSRYTGGGMLMAPDAGIDDGLMDVVMVRALNRRRLLLSLPRIFTGSHIRMTETTVARGRTATISTPGRQKQLLPDGEILGTTPGTIDVMPGKLRYISW